MSNFYYFLFSITLIFTVFINKLTIIKIENTLALVNENLVYDCVTYKGLIDSTQEDDPKYLYLNQEKLKQIIEDILSSNLTNIEYKVEYYFYDYSCIDEVYIAKEYCNSVQIKITINYQNKPIENIYRFEPVKRGD